MELSSWHQQELESLAMVYIKHRQLHRAAALRKELAARIERTAANEVEQLEKLLGALDNSNVVSLSQRIRGLASKTTSLFGPTKKTA